MLDEIMDTLSNSHRRQILFTLYDYERPIDVDTPTDKTIIYEKDLEEQQIELVHYHLPQLEESGFIQWDRDDELVEPGPQFHEIEPFLELIDEYDWFTETGP